MNSRPHLRRRARSACAVGLLAATLIACGDATCPKGSSSVGGDCVPLEQQCARGEQLEDGQCRMMGGIRADAGGRDGRDAAAPRGDAGAGNPESPCDAIDCGDHGRCDEALAACVCDDGWLGERCERCPEAMGPSADGASCVPLCESTQAPDCGEHGACTIADGAASCACERGFAGAACAECAELFRMDDGGDCVADCGECGPHALCDDSGELPACVCAPGYRDGGDGCTWVGDGENGAGLVDGELDDPTAWQTRHVVIDRGTATFVNAIVDGECELGWLSQRFAMPALEQAEPFALDLAVTTPCTSSDPAQCPPLLVEIGHAVSRVQVPGATAGATRTVSVCLGDAGYGEDVALRVRPGLAGGLSSAAPPVFDCETTAWPKIEAIALRAASTSECALDAGVINGELDAAEGWTLRSAAIAGGRLQLDAGGTAATRIVVPAAERMPSPALRVETDPSSNSGLRVALGGLIWSYAPGVLCLPDWAQGAGHDLELQSPGAARVVEALAIESDPACGDGRLDAGFERDVTVLGRGSWYGIVGYFALSPQAAHTGSQGVRFTDAINAIGALMRIPESTSSTGPAFELQFRTSSTSASARLQVEPFAVAADLSSTQWTRHVTCLDRRWEGQLAVVALGAGLSGANAQFDVDDAGPTLSDVCE